MAGDAAGRWRGVLATALVLALGAATAPASAAEHAFNLSFKGPAVLTGRPGTILRATCRCALQILPAPTPDAPVLVDGWAISIDASGARIVAITVAGTAGEQALECGFVRSEVTTGPGNEGAISEVIYSIRDPRSLVVDSTSVLEIAEIEVEAQVPESPRGVLLRYRDFLTVASGERVENFVQSAGERRVPRRDLWGVTIGPAQSIFRLGLRGPDRLIAEPGAIGRGTFFCTLAGSPLVPGASVSVDGWSIGLAADGAVISSITLGGTAAEWALDHGFVRNEITSGPGNAGAISQVTYSLVEPTSLGLSKGQTLDIAALEVEAPISEGLEGTSILLRYRDGLVGSAGVLDNRIVEAGEIRVPSVPDARVVALWNRWCGIATFGFSEEPLDNLLPFRGLIGGPQTSGLLEIQVPEGEVGSARLYANVVSTLDEVPRQGVPGIDGWALSIEVTGEAEPVAVSFDGSPASERMHGGFAIAHLADPSLTGGRRGFVSAAVLSMQFFGWLPPRSTVSVLELDIRPTDIEGAEVSAADLRFADGLSPPGARAVPWKNQVVLNGWFHVPCNLDVADVTLRFRRGPGTFRRGDANEDGSVNISDALTVLGLLFLGGAPPRCADAADFNDDERVEISDPVYLLRHLFASGPAPPAPFPECGGDKTETRGALGCNARQDECR